MKTQEILRRFLNYGHKFAIAISCLESYVSLSGRQCVVFWVAAKRCLDVFDFNTYVSSGCQRCNELSADV